MDLSDRMKGYEDAYPSLDRIRHGDECPDCGGCVVWNESEDFSGCVLQCDECNTIFG